MAPSPCTALVRRHPLTGDVPSETTCEDYVLRGTKHTREARELTQGLRAEKESNVLCVTAPGELGPNVSERKGVIAETEVLDEIKRLRVGQARGR